MILFESPANDRPVTVVSDAGAWHGQVNAGGGTYATVSVCQPAGSFTDVTITTPGVSLISGDMRDVNSFGPTAASVSSSRTST